MSHIHIPDGILPLWIVALGWAVAGAALIAAARSIGKREAARRLPLLGVVAAVMVVSMTAEIVPIAYHVNLSIIAGIILGPALGFIAAFIVNIILALFGHGGLTVVGLNTIVIGTEVVAGYYLFVIARRITRDRLGIGLVAAGVTFITLLISTGVMVSIIALSNINPGQQGPLGTAVEPQTLSFKNPFTGEILSFELLARKEHEAPPTMDLGTFIKLVITLGLFGWVLEAALTGLVARYLQRVKPDVLVS